MMPSLLHQLDKLPTTGMITYAGEHISVAELIKRAGEIRQQYPQFHQLTIAVYYTNLAEFITALIAFDGWCSAIYLCPPDVSIPKKELIKWPLEDGVADSDLVKNQQAGIWLRLALQVSQNGFPTLCCP